MTRLFSLRFPSSAAAGFAVVLLLLAQQSLSAPPFMQADHIKTNSALESDAPPVRVLNIKPIYSENARAAGVRGLVIVGFTIGVDGAVTQTEVHRSVPLLDQAAIDAVKRWRFKPALSHGVAVPATRVTAISFP
jgi:protein TonB